MNAPRKSATYRRALQVARRVGPVRPVCAAAGEAPALAATYGGIVCA